MRKIFAIAALAALPASLLAQTPAGVGQDAAIRSAVQELNPEAVITSIAATPIAGIREVNSEGNIVYITSDGRYMLTGDLIDLRSRANRSEQARATYRGQQLATAPIAERIVFKAAAEKAKIFVFTDISCGYCQMLHRNMAEYNRLGITVEYLAWPRAGLNSGDFVKMRNIWCSADRNKAMNDAISGRPVPAANCANPIANQVALGHQVGVEATPAVYSANGTQLGGYLEPARMAQALGLR